MKTSRTVIITGICLTLIVQAGCMRGNSASSNPSVHAKASHPGSPGVKLRSGDEGHPALQDSEGIIPLAQQNGIAYVEANRVVAMLGMDAKWDAEASTYTFGDRDENYAVEVGSKTGRKDGDPVELAEASMLIGSSVYLPVSAVSSLLHEELSYRLDGSQMFVKPAADPDEQALLSQSENADVPVTSELDFADDPDDPFKNDSAVRAINELPVWASPSMDRLQAVAAAAPLKNISMPALIRKAYQYMGARYIFGASSYANTGGFDCSSYTQYTFGKFGIQLPRLARQQARVGTSVGRKNLRVGDLVFFYIPGRFKSNKIAGHVGIYVGNGKMINADNQPKNGVQITNMDKSFWKRTFICARRVAH